MAAYVRTLPPCICRGKEWLFLKSYEKKEKGLRECECRCTSCFRPGHVVHHAYGSAFLVPQKGVQEMPSGVFGFISGALLDFFEENLKQLNRLRGEYEENQYRRICTNIGISPFTPALKLSKEKRKQLTIECVKIFGADWWLPATFVARSMPVLPKATQMYVRMAVVDGAVENAWFDLIHGKLG